MNGAAKTGLEIQVQNAAGEWENLGYVCHIAAQTEAMIEVARNAGKAFRVWSNALGKEVTERWV